MSYDARQIANWFVARAKRDSRPLSIMSLLKLTYIAHGWHLESQKSPLFRNRIEAWQYGPVIPEVYGDFRRQGVAVHSPVDTVPQVQFDATVEDLLEQVWNIYGKLDPFRLSDLTHVPGGPWDVASRRGGNYATIPNDLIQAHYIKLRRRANEVAANG